MNNDKKVKVQQRIIEDLQKSNEALEKENLRLSDELELEKLLPKEGYEKAKKLICDLEDRKTEYEQLIIETKSIQSEYKEKIREINELKKKYKKDMKSVLKEITKSAKSVKK